MVVQKRHHTRLFPADHGARARDSTDRSGNIMPGFISELCLATLQVHLFTPEFINCVLFLSGTVVDTTICHPREFDFYLNSHAGIQVMPLLLRRAFNLLFIFLKAFDKLPACIGCIYFSGNKPTNSLPCIVR